MNTITTVGTEDSASTLIPAQEHEDQIIVEAIDILNRRLFNRSAPLHNPEDVRRFLQLKFMSEKRERFAVAFCDFGQRVIAFEVLSHGSLSFAALYPRDVVERALFHNAAAVILAHNNPSGRTQPSDDDRRATAGLKAALDLVDVRIVDHIIIGEGRPFSFAESGLL